MSDRTMYKLRKILRRPGSVPRFDLVSQEPGHVPIVLTSQTYDLGELAYKARRCGVDIPSQGVTTVSATVSKGDRWDQVKTGPASPGEIVVFNQEYARRAAEERRSPGLAIGNLVDIW